jgi:hypothetical protein
MVVSMNGQVLLVHPVSLSRQIRYSGSATGVSAHFPREIPSPDKPVPGNIPGTPVTRVQPGVPVPVKNLIAAGIPGCTLSSGPVIPSVAADGEHPAGNEPGNEKWNTMGRQGTGSCSPACYLPVPVWLPQLSSNLPLHEHRFLSSNFETYFGNSGHVFIRSVLMEVCQNKDRCEVGKMTIADGMHQIVDNINGARAARTSDIAGLVREVGSIRSGAQKDLKLMSRVRKHNAASQKKTLHRYVKTLRHDTLDMLGGFSASRMAMGQESREELGDFCDQLKKDVTDIRLDAVHMIHGFADERVSRGIELSRMLGSYNDGIIGDVQNLMGMFKKERIPFQEDLAEAHGIWQNERSGGHEAAKVPKRPGAKAVKKTQTAEEKEEALLKQKILNVINATPAGITLVKTGKKVGVEWRKLVRPAKELVAAGLVAKKETQYFPN